MTNQNFKNVLFINFGGIGDEILFFPTLQDFKKTYPECKVSLLVEPRSASCAGLTDTIDELIKYDVKSANKVTAFLDLLRILSKGGYDAVVSSGSNKFIAVLLFLSGIKTRVGYDSGGMFGKLLSTAVALNKNQYAGNMYHDLLNGVGINKDTPAPNIIVPEEAITKAEQMLGKKEKPFIVVHPGVSKLSIQKNIIKGWPEQKWAELIATIVQTNKAKVVLTGGPDDDEAIKKIVDILEQSELPSGGFINLYGQTRNLTELAAVIKLSDVILCVDSAPMHVAVGVGTKIVAIFGPTDEKKLLPIDNNIIAVRNQDLDCRPCLWDKRQYSCEKGSCLDISVETMMDAINTLQILE